jgi:glycosyltransferase involved in cell wall biosynthesis
MIKINKNHKKVYLEQNHISTVDNRKSILKNINKIKMALVLSNFYTPGFPSWPEIMGVYGVELPKKGHTIDWYMPYNATNLKQIKKIIFQHSTVYLIPQIKSKNYLFQLISILIYQIRLFFIIFKNNKMRHYNIFQARDDVFSGITFLIIKKILRKPFTFNYSFPFYEGALDHYNLGRLNKIQLINYQLQDIVLKKILFKNVNYLFPISNQMKKNLAKEGISAEKMHPLTEGVEPELFKINNHQIGLKNKLNINQNDTLFTYVGSLGILRGVGLIVEALEIVVKTYPNTKVLFVGSDHSNNQLKTYIKTKNLANDIIFTGQVSYFEVPNYIYISDACISIVRDLPSFHVSSPCKIFEYMLIGKPVIANNEIPEQKMTIEESKGGEAIRFDKTDLANAMIKYIENKANLVKIGNNGKKWVIKNRSFKVISQKLEEIYLEILHHGN